MSALSQLRTDLRDKLTDAGIFAFTIVPEKAVPPFAYVAPDDPYIDYEGGIGLAYGEALVRHRIGLVTPTGVNEVQADALDEFVLTVLAIDFKPHVLETVDEPGQILVNGQKHLAATVHLSTPFNPQEIE